MILNKKAIANQESQLFRAELEKFRPHQNRLLQANHKQASVLKELTKSYSNLLQDKRVRSEQNKYETFSRQRNTVMTKYRKIFQAFNDLVAGLAKAQEFYSEMKETVESLSQNIETFVNNRRSEGGQLLSQIEAAKENAGGAYADRERERLKDLMERMSMGPSDSSPSPYMHTQSPRPNPMQQNNPTQLPPHVTSHHSSISTPAPNQYNAQQTNLSTQRQPYQHHHSTNGSQQSGPQISATPSSFNTQYASAPEPYNPINYPPVSPPPNQQHFSSHLAAGGSSSMPYGVSNFQPSEPQQYTHQQPQQSQHMPPGYVPPPPPPGPPPPQLYQDYSHFTATHPAGPGGYAQSQPRGPPQQQQQQHGSQDPWQGLNAWR